MDKEVIDVLKKPFDWDMNTVRGAIKKAYPNSSGYITRSKLILGNGLIDVNFNVGVAEVHGNFNVYDSGGKVIGFLEKYFKYPLLPTEEERTLFKIELGVDYPLPAINLGGC